MRSKQKNIINVYMAGKMTGGTVNDKRHILGTWRNEIFDIEGNFLMNNQDSIHPSFKSLTHFKDETEIVYGDTIFRYIAPYPVDAGGHGLNYGENKHGVYDCDDRFAKDGIFEQCKSGIRSADIVFSWIDSPTAYGTLYELGMCYSIGKPVFLAMPTEFQNAEISVTPRDLWFPTIGVEQFIYVNTLKQAWSLFMRVAEQMIEESKGAELTRL